MISPGTVVLARDHNGPYGAVVRAVHADRIELTFVPVGAAREVTPDQIITSLKRTIPLGVAIPDTQPAPTQQRRRRSR